jgi:hypothetical protein
MGYDVPQATHISFLKDSNREWKGVKIHIFDAPQALTNAYSERLSLLQQSTTLSVVLLIFRYFSFTFSVINSSSPDMSKQRSLSFILEGN